MAETANNPSESLHNTAHYGAAATAKPLTWSQKMSNHIAYALLTYTGLQIFVGMSAIKGDSRSILPYFALVALVALVIPACRNFERRWEHMANNDDMAYARLFRRDTILLWCAAIAFPFIVAGTAKILHAIF
jgi:hypothetical protein